jgi:enoyl-CoA hydratase
MIRHERDGNVALLSLAHGRANALDIELLEAFIEALEAENTGDADAVVLTGSGSTFCAGVDLLRVLAGGRNYLAGYLPTLSKAFETLFRFPKPVIAAVNGHAIAGGCVLVCACDIRLMAAGGGRIGLSELRVGVPFPLSALEIVRFAIGDQKARELAYRGELHTPEKALDLGLIDEVVEARQLVDRAREVAEQLVAVPQQAFALTKRMLRQPVFDRLDAHAAEVDSEVFEFWQSAEAAASMAEFMQRTVGRSR